MNKLLEKVKELYEKFKSQSKKVRIASIVAFIAIIVAIIMAIFYTSSNKYAVLFSDLDADDAKTIVDTLTKDKVETKLDSNTNTIYVPKNQVDQLKLELAPSIKSGSVGYELMDEQSSFGMTDEEFKLKKKRMLEGELEKTIKRLDSIENAKVSITQANNSIFVKDTTEGTASVTIELKKGTSLNEEQVKAIVAVVSSSVENVPKENVSVIDQNMNWLTKDISFDEDNNTSSESISKRQDQEKNYKQELQKAINEILEPLIGKGKVKSQVSVNFNYDSTQKTVTTVDPNKVIVSQETVKEFNGTGDSAAGDSPVDNNISNEITEDTTNSSSTREEQKTNYDSGKSEVKTIVAPGKVERMTASVVVDRNLTDSESEKLQELVSNAIGIDELKGHKLTVLGMPFDTTDEEEAKAQLEQMNLEAAARKNNMMMAAGGIALAIVIGGIILLIIKKRRKNAEEEEQLLDTIIDDTIVPKEPDTFDPIEFEAKSEKTHLENEIKKYATEKPEQVVEIIKSWLNENEG